MSELRAILKGLTPPDASQKERIVAFLEEKYGAQVDLVWENDPTIASGFRLEIGSDVYDWSLKGRFVQLQELWKQLPSMTGGIIPLLQDTVKNWTPRALAEEVGTVLTVGDGIATVGGLEHAAYGEILIFSSGIRGMVQDLRQKEIGCILFGEEQEILQGSIVKRTGMMAGIPVGEDFVGRVINALGAPIDGKGAIQEEDYRPIEAPAPNIIDRQPVNTPEKYRILLVCQLLLRLETEINLLQLGRFTAYFQYGFISKVVCVCFVRKSFVCVG